LIALMAVVAAIATALLIGHRRHESDQIVAVGEAQHRLLTPDEYRNVIRDVFGGDIAIGGHYDPLARTDGLLRIGAGRASITPSQFEQFDGMARAIADQMVDEAHRPYLIGCAPAAANAPDDSCARQFLARIGRLLHRHRLAADDLDSVVAVSRKAAQSTGSFYQGLAYGLASLLDAPQFLLVSDTLETQPVAPDTYRLDGYSKASRLSFLLWNSTPDDELLSAAERGELDTKKGLARQADRLIASPRLKDGVRAFFSDMLGFDALDELQKDAIIYPAFTQKVAEDAREQALRTIDALLVDQRGDYRDLFTTHKTFMTGPLGLLYDVPVAEPEGWSPYEFAEDDPRAGIVTQLAFVALHAHPGRSSATLRGKAVRELILCQHVPAPPANVNFNLVQDVKNPEFKTARQRLTAHRTNPTCAGCHRIMDPIGLTLEQFDGAGQFRSMENGASIDVTDEIDGAKIGGGAGLGKFLHDNPATTSCLVSRLYAYAVGRKPTAGEAKWLSGDISQGFAADGYRLADLLRRIATSD
jgi:hypothetical protein